MRLLGMTPKVAYGYRGYYAVVDRVKRHTLRAHPLIVGADYMLTTGSRFTKGGPERTGIVVQVTRVERWDDVRISDEGFTFLSDDVPGVRQSLCDAFAIADGFISTADGYSPYDNFLRFMRTLYRTHMPSTMWLNHFEVVGSRCV